MKDKSFTVNSPNFSEWLARLFVGLHLAEISHGHGGGCWFHCGAVDALGNPISFVFSSTPICSNTSFCTDAHALIMRIGLFFCFLLPHTVSPAMLITSPRSFSCTWFVHCVKHRLNASGSICPQTRANDVSDDIPCRMYSWGMSLHEPGKPGLQEGSEHK